MMTATASKLLNVGLYQLGWCFCVLGAAWGYPLIGTALALLTMLTHLVLAGSPKTEASLMFSACLIGITVDSAQQFLGVLTFKPGPISPLGLPLWIIIIWAQFATLFHYALFWLRGRYLLGALCGLLGGPLAYWGGVRLGAADFGAHVMLSLLSLALVWSLVTPLLIWLSEKIGGTEGIYRRPLAVKELKND